MYDEIDFIDNSNSASNRLFSFEGRICRKDFWKSVLKAILIGLIASLVIGPCLFIWPAFGSILRMILMAFTTVIICAAASKRFHDLGYSAAIPVTVSAASYVLSGIFTILEISGYKFVVESMSSVSFVILPINIVVIYIVAGCLRGNEGMNQYGSNPLRDFDEQLREYNGEA